MPLQAIGGTAGMVGDALNTGINMVAGTHLGSGSWGMPSQAIQRGIDAITPTPDGVGEKVGDFVGSVAAGGIRGGVDPLARAITSRLGGAAATGLSEKAKTFAEGQQLGLVATPSTSGGGATGRTVEALAGRDQLKHAAITRNQAVYDDIARRTAALPADAPLTKEALTGAISSAWETGYKPLTQLGWLTNGRVYREALDKALTDFQGASRSFPDAAKAEVRDLVNSYRVRGFDSGDAIKQISALREGASSAYAAGKPEVGKASRAIADALENSIELNLGAMGGDGAAMLKQFRDSRTLMAKQYVIRDAVVEGTGSIDPAKLRKNIGNGKRLTGELSTAAKFANTFPKVSHIDTAQASPATWLDRLSIMGAGPAMLLHPAIGASMIGGVVGRGAARAGMLTGPGQRMFGPGAARSLNPGILNAIPTAVTQSGLYGVSNEIP